MQRQRDRQTAGRETNKYRWTDRQTDRDKHTYVDTQAHRCVQGCLSDSRHESHTWSDPWLTQVGNVWDTSACHCLAVCVSVYMFLGEFFQNFQDLPLTFRDNIMRALRNTTQGKSTTGPVTIKLNMSLQTKLILLNLTVSLENSGSQRTQNHCMLIPASSFKSETMVPLTWSQALGDNWKNETTCGKNKHLSNGVQAQP